jgi:hypothetical protein
MFDEVQLVSLGGRLCGGLLWDGGSVALAGAEVDDRVGDDVVGAGVRTVAHGSIRLRMQDSMAYSPSILGDPPLDDARLDGLLAVRTRAGWTRICKPWSKNGEETQVVDSPGRRRPSMRRPRVRDKLLFS